MYLPALSVGYAVPDANFEAEVHSAFQAALNLRVNGEPYLLTLIASGEGELPQGIRLDTPQGFSFEGFQAGERVTCRDGILHFEQDALTVQLSTARRWKCDLPALRFDPADPTVSAAWGLIWKMLNERQRRLEAEIIAEEVFNESARTEISRRTGEAIRVLLSATRRAEVNPSPIESLIGLGSGLTPSGDDLLVGCLAGLWCTVGDRSEHRQFVAELGKTVIAKAMKTNDISRTYLYHAAQGQVSSRLADLAGAICRGENPERLREIAETAMSVGHTSGMDAVTGLLIGLAAWTSPANSHF